MLLDRCPLNMFSDQHQNLLSMARIVINFELRTKYYVEAV